MRPTTLLKAPGECDSLRQAKVTLQNKHAGQRNGGGWKLVTIGTVTFRMLKGGEVFPVSRFCGPVSFTHTHSSIHSHIMDTHRDNFHRFWSSRNRQTSRRRKKILLCKPFKDWAVVTANLIPNSSQHNLREKNNLTHTDMMILMDAMESELRTYCV